MISLGICVWLGFGIILWHQEGVTHLFAKQNMVRTEKSEFFIVSLKMAVTE